MAKYLAPLLLKGNGLIGYQDDRKHAGVIVNMTAKVSSITGKNNICTCCCHTYHD